MAEKILNLRLFCKNITLDDRAKDYVIKRIQKLEKFLKRTLEYEVEISRDKKGLIYAEIMLKTPYNLFRSEHTSESVESSIDEAVEEMQRQIVRDMDRLRDLRKRGARSVKKKLNLDEKARF